MGYSFTQADDPIVIHEREYQRHPEVRFSLSHASIGVLSRNSHQITAVHLVLASNGGNMFNYDTIETVVGLLGTYQQVVIIGQTNLWQEVLPHPYHCLCSRLNSPIIINKPDGIYGARIHQNIFQTYQNGSYLNV